MSGGTSWENAFGGPSPLAPANPSYFALSLAQPTDLVWPLETTGGAPHLASQIDVTALASNLRLSMPPGNTGSTGAQSMVTNIGAVAFTVTDSHTNPIISIQPSQSWLVTLIDNTTENGSWRAYQLGGTPSAANSTPLAGPGLQAVGTALRTVWLTQTIAADTSLTPAQHATLMVWKGAAGTLRLNASATLTPGWYCAVTNEGTGALTVSASAGETVNGVAALVMNPGNSGIFVCAAGAFNTVGALVTTLPVVSGGTGATTPAQARTNLGATAIGSAIFSAPNAAAVTFLLGTTNNLQVGDMKETALPESLIASLMPGWHVCDGSERPRTDPLWAATGQVNLANWAYGLGNGSTTYNLPDRRGRAAIGKDNMGGVAAGRVTAGVSGVNGAALGGAGGSEALHSHGHTASAAVSDPTHGHGVSDGGHVHGVGDPGHGHVVSDGGHGHGVNDFTHSHGVNDPTHTHGYSQAFESGNSAAFGPNAALHGLQGNQTIGAGTGISIASSGANISIAGSGSNIGIVPVGTGVLVQSNVTGVTVAGAGTGVTVGVTVNGNGSGASQNMPPVLVETIVIFTGA